MPLSDTSTDKQSDEDEDSVGERVSDRSVCEEAMGKDKFEDEMLGIVFRVSYIKSFESILCYFKINVKLSFKSVAHCMSTRQFTWCKVHWPLLPSSLAARVRLCRI